MTARVLRHPTAETIQVSAQTLIELAEQANQGEALTLLASHVHDLVSLTKAVLQDARRGVTSQHAADNWELMAHRLSFKVSEELSRLREDTDHIHDTCLELVVAEPQTAEAAQ